MMQATVVAGRRVAVAPSRANRMPLASRRVVPVRAQAEEPNSTPSTSSSAPTPSSSPLKSAPASEEVQGPTGSLALLGPVQEAINGRAAMLGFVAAVISEAATHQAVWSQVAGRYAADGDLLEAPVGTATLLFGAIVALVTMATLVPKMVAGEEVDSRSFGPFTPGLEKTLGRVAQIGFAGLLVVELVKGSALLG